MATKQRPREEPGLQQKPGDCGSRANVRRGAHRRVSVALLVPAAVYGGSVTAAKWDRTCAHYKAEGTYYLKHPHRLIYSEVPAYWYLEGVRWMYAIPKRHHVAPADETMPIAAQLAGFDTIWRQVDGRFISDRALFLRLEGNVRSPSP